MTAAREVMHAALRGDLICECGATAPEGTPGWTDYGIGGGVAECCPRCRASLEQCQSAGVCPEPECDAECPAGEMCPACGCVFPLVSDLRPLPGCAS